MNDRLPVHALILAFAVVLGSTALFALPDPDRAKGRSDDGRFTAAGPFSSIRVERISDRVASAGVAPAYRVTVDEAAPMRPYEVALAYDPDWAAKRFPGAALALWGYDPAAGAWRRAASQDDRADGRLMADAAAGLSDWTAAPADPGPASTVSPALLDALLSFPPSGTVGYEAFSAVAEPGSEDFFLVAEPLSRGGCGGAFVRGREIVATKEVAEPTGITRVAVRFQGGTGCPPDAPLAPSP
ncbi:hypothetical protein EPO34_01980 [Patescibacteria group bacterium]|nr:MAG: hypothetical protein EPO34_01980 [Patescibacteria group bacterium]